MLMIDEPTMFDDDSPIGTFVVIAVDPAASVKLLDDHAKREAAEMTPTRCLAIVDGDNNCYFTGLVQPMNPAFLLAGKGLPPHPESWAAVPVAPADPHPETGRLPVRTDRQMRWSDCHLYTLCGVAGLVSRIYQHRVKGPSLSEDEYQKVVISYMEDDLRWAERENARLAQEQLADRPASPEPLPVEAFEHEFDENWISDFLPDPEHAVKARLTLSFELWVDTSTLDDLTDPARVIVDIKRLEEIERDWAQRVVAAELADQPGTEAWLKNIADAEAPSEVESIPAYNEELDSLINPEDAVDHRAAPDTFLSEQTESGAALLEQASNAAALSSSPSATSHSSRGNSELAAGSSESNTTPDVQLGCSTSTCIRVGASAAACLPPPESTAIPSPE